MPSCRLKAALYLAFALFGVAHAFAQTTFYSRQAGAWSALTSWSTVPGGAAAAVLPAAMDIVIIGDPAHTISLDQTTAIGELRILSGTLQYDNALARVLTINGDLRIEAAGTLTVRTVGAGVANALLLRGNVVNNGTWTMRPVANSNSYRAVTVFIGTNLQTIVGMPILTRLYRILLNKSGVANVVDCAIDMGIGDPAALTIDNMDFSTVFFGGMASIGGTWRQSSGTLRFGDGCGDRSQQIEPTGSLQIVGNARLMFGQNAGATFILGGGELLINSTGMPSQIGVAAGNSLAYDSPGGISRFRLLNGRLIIAGRFARHIPAVSDLALIDYEQSGGTLIVGAAGNETTTRRGLFEIPVSASSFTMSGGTIILRNANPQPTRPADFFLGLGVNASISGGTIQFSDASSLANQRFDWNTPPTLVWSNVLLSSPSARLHPFDATQNLRLGGNFTVNGSFDGTQTRTNVAAASTLTLQGTNAATQTLSGVGTITAQNLVLNRQSAGNGVALASLPLTVRGIVDLQEGSNPQPQVLELGINADLRLTNSATNAVADAAENRSLRTSASGGRFYRTLSGNGDYLFPLSSAGSSLNAAFTYTPLIMRAVGASGEFGIRVAAGANTTQIGAHMQMPATATSYVRRVWSCVSVGAVGGTAQIVPSMTSAFADFTGSLVVARLARYRPNEDVSGNLWRYSDTAVAQAAAEWSGDWALIEGLNRVFFSRASGVWTDANAWSFVSHTGAAVPVGVFPSRLTDSVIIGGGTLGVENHVLTLTANASVGAVLLGTSATNTGTLECTQENRLSGLRFVLAERSTLRIGSARGIEALPSDEGNIGATLERRFSQNAQYDYIGTGAQVFGSALPSSIFALRVAKPLGAVLLAERDCTIWRNLLLSSGTLDAQGFALRNVTTATLETRTFTLEANAMLRIGAMSGFADASTGTVRGFGVYNLDERSTVEFYGANQATEPIPTGIGYGNLSISGTGTKTAWNPLLVRNDMTVQNGALFVNNSRGAGLQVLGSLKNSAGFINNGVAEFGR